MTETELLALASEIRGLCAIVTKVARRDLQAALDSHQAGISGLEHGVLRRLTQGYDSLAEISRAMGTLPSTLVAVLDGLEAKRFIKRGQDRNDRRRTPVVLTAKGKRFWATLPGIDADSVLVRSLADMRQSTRVRLRGDLRALVEGLQAADQASAPPRQAPRGRLRT
jgi:DNA-binding MarR family transcriptional regulator